MNPIETERALVTLGEQLAVAGASADFVISGGAGLQVLGLIDRSTKDHEKDLLALRPTPDELAFAAAWVRSQDPSPGFDSMLVKALDYLEKRDA